MRDPRRLLLAAALLAPALPAAAQPDTGTITIKVPDSIGVFRMVQRKDFEDRSHGVLLRYERADSLRADVFVYAGPDFDKDCDLACARAVLKEEGDGFVGAFPQLVSAKYVDSIAVTSDSALAPPAGAPWRWTRSGRRPPRSSHRY